MLRARLCNLLGIDEPIILAGMGSGANRLSLPRRSPMKAPWGALGRFFSLRRPGQAGHRPLTDPDQPQFRDQSHSANLGC